MTLLRFHNRALLVADETMKRTMELATRAASSLAPVLLCGESGTGKELIARFIHEKSRRSRGPFVSVNCAAIPDGLMEAELFGFERGAFTGAVQQRIGKFEQANGGTLLLDEVSEMSVALQAKLLRVLQEGEVDRLGAKEAVPINSRIIATTNRDLRHLMDQSSFREDLFYRLNVIRIECVALRGRSEAILALSEQFLQQSAENQERRGLSFSASAADKLAAHHWPGNIRELQNTIERAVLICDGRVVQPQHIELLHREAKPSAAPQGHLLAAVEQAHILRVVGQASGNRTEAARMLGISIRTLRNKLNEYEG